MRGAQGSGKGQCRRQGQGMTGGFSPNRGMGGECVCPACGATAPHQAGVRCLQVKCPKCGIGMVRK